MRKATNVPLVFPLKVEANIQKIAKVTGYSRNEVIQGLVMAFFDRSDSPGENVAEFVALVKRALRELNAGG